jgi:transcriptional antiterminator RfaH
MSEEYLKTDPNLNNRPWYLAYTKPRLENIAKDNLAQQGFEVFLPLFKKFKNTETGLFCFFDPLTMVKALPRFDLPRESIIWCVLGLSLQCCKTA